MSAANGLPYDATKNLQTTVTIPKIATVWVENLQGYRSADKSQVSITITVKGQAGSSPEGIQVFGVFETGLNKNGNGKPDRTIPVSCVTNSSGQCSSALTSLITKDYDIRYTIDNLTDTNENYAYDSSSNNEVTIFIENN